ncbi:hypothetical protein F0562_034537 [Nyssa sinensis]|uniref:BHLH domain-containing protein n=1 Tax=Nyssa sinensis TaxID=561372 RepID=A0A5J5AKJ3_9ASTE|nr:hypothetical protein F0562_034537 [Nyssa sinensis]
MTDQLKMKENTINTTIANFSPIYPKTFLVESPLHFHVSIPETSCSLDSSNSTTVPLSLTYIRPPVTVKKYTDSSSMVVVLETGNQVTQMEKMRENIDCKVAKEGKCKKRKSCDDGMSKNREEKNLKADHKEKKTVSEDAPTGYVHVRARRGQATDSHSLAERVRREKISERMRLLQSLVPGCDKVTGKALILDEVINYVQSLQNQVKFLVMKLASVYPMLNDLKVDHLDTNTPASETLCSLEAPLPSVPQSDFIHLKSILETALSSSSFLLEQEEITSYVFSRVDGDLLWDMDEQMQKLVNHYGFSDLCSF